MDRRHKGEPGMKRMMGALAILAMLTTATAIAQEKAEARQSKQQLQAERKNLIAKHLKLTDQEGPKFWLVYEEYSRAIGKVEARRAMLMRTFAENQQSMTDEKATELLTEFLDVREARVKLQKSFVPKFKAVLPVRKVARFYQIDHRLDTSILSQLAQAFPLVE
jgi:UTP:GlnB (protein PII) uridylyltransferase